MTSRFTAWPFSLRAVVGAAFGIRFTASWILKALGLVLVIAGLKLIGS